MRVQLLIGIVTVSLCSCAGEPKYDPLDSYEELHATTILDAPSINLADVAPRDRKGVAHGEYMVELLGCGTCHTHGALEGAPNMAAPLAGSDIGIAYTSPLQNRYPGITFPPNITSDIATGIGGWSDDQLAAAIRKGQDRHGGSAARTMPWPGYAKLSDEDTVAIILYLRSSKAVSHRVPENIRPGSRSSESFVYFGFYREN
jgi:hypothetical protein